MASSSHLRPLPEGTGGEGFRRLPFRVLDPLEIGLLEAGGSCRTEFLSRRGMGSALVQVPGDSALRSAARAVAGYPEALFPTLPGWPLIRCLRVRRAWRGHV